MQTAVQWPEANSLSYQVVRSGQSKFLPPLWRSLKMNHTGVEQILFFVGLSLLSYQDYKKKEVSTAAIVVLGFGGVLFRTADSGTQWISVLTGIGIGIVMLALSCLSRGKIGAGDGWILIVGAMYLELWDFLRMFISALYLAGITGLLLLFTKKCNRESSVPFYPFLLAGYVAVLWHNCGWRLP